MNDGGWKVLRVDLFAVRQSERARGSLPVAQTGGAASRQCGQLIGDPSEGTRRNSLRGAANGLASDNHGSSYTLRIAVTTGRGT